MSIICPTILALDPHGYREQLQRVEGLSKRIQIDLADGDFAKNKTVIPAQIYWGKQQIIDLHVMYRFPQEHLDKLIALRPHMIILHAECEGDLTAMFTRIEEEGIETGLAILPDTSVDSVAHLILQVNHVLIFAGSLGFFGGDADLEMLDKVDEIRGLDEDIEIGWDGGVNDEIASRIIEAGIDVLNVGSFIQRSQEPDKAYAILEQIAQDVG